MDNPTISKEKEVVGDCQVCEQPGHGVHFGVHSCRACAAFFRRTVVYSREYPCRRGDEKCQIQKGSRIICRKCRYNKCVQLGMTPDNVQYNRDRMNSSKPGCSKSKNKDAELPTDLESPPQPPKPLRLESLVAPIEDRGAEGIIERLKAHFSCFNPAIEIPGIWEQEPLTRMYMALMRHRRNQVKTVEELKFLTEIKLPDMKKNWETTMTKVAEWFSFSHEFSLLPFKEKLLIFQDRWKVFMRLERLLMSIDFFGPSVLQEKIMLFSDNCAAYIKNVKVDISAISDYDSDYIRSFFDPIIDNVFEKVLTPLVEMCLSPMEGIYLLCQISFSVEGLDLPYETMDLIVDFRDKISDELHNYYMTIGLTNYATRLMDLLGICQSMESIQSQREQVMELIKIFDYIKLDEHTAPCLKTAAKKYI